MLRDCNTGRQIGLQQMSANRANRGICRNTGTGISNVFCLMPFEVVMRMERRNSNTDAQKHQQKGSEFGFETTRGHDQKRIYRKKCRTLAHL